MKDFRILTDEDNDFYPITTTDAIGHDQMQSRLTKLINTYNLSLCFPEEGPFELQQAVEFLASKLEDEQKVPGVHVEFINSSGEHEEWEYYGTDYKFNYEGGWRRVDSSVILEIQETLFPVSVNFSSSPTLVQTGKATDVKFSWSVYRKGADVSNSALKYFNNNKTDELSKTVTINEASHTTISYTFSASYQGLSASSVKNITVVDPCYYNINGESTLETSLKNSRAFTWTDINLNNQIIRYAYPAYHGKLTSIKDANNFEYINSYTFSEGTINGVSYYIYQLTTPVTVSGFKQIFS
jgi:hypothetical protein